MILHAHHCRIKLSLTALFIAIILSGCQRRNQQYVVMLSLDGFRWDYPALYETPNLDRMAEQGVMARSLKPSFPTKTFPNHYTIATGLYPDHHGIVLNSFYDPDMDAYYSIGDRTSVENPDFYGGEPIWLTAEKQGVISGSYFWVGSEAPIGGRHPTYWKSYEHEFPFTQRLDSVIGWLRLPYKKRPRLITWYMDEPDSQGHDLGPFHPEMGHLVFYLDSLVGVFLDRIQDLPISNRINVIVTSDHGMAETSSERWINLSDYVNREWFRNIQGGNPNYNLQVKPEYYDTAWKSLQVIPHVQVWERGTLPGRFHYGEHPRITDFILLADSSWIVSWREKPAPFTGGSHGYDNRNTDMHAIFYAQGPAFRNNLVHPTFENIHIYPLVCRILDIQPAPVDGDVSFVESMLE
jgi:alkaline phosphatase D